MCIVVSLVTLTGVLAEHSRMVGARNRVMKITVVFITCTCQRAVHPFIFATLSRSRARLLAMTNSPGGLSTGLTFTRDTGDNFFLVSIFRGYFGIGPVIQKNNLDPCQGLRGYSHF